ncbi:hypothetical protein RFI_25131 [Reticulomyxa filosa]|uniref:Uncharacterized protein n=1 Tax=Reticulomyxa filosa TaxID=46433 RepID=X6MF04_RETFI|nr:hypothetical protein RFI_25131 [Reticulomyxa filosa]|eukprot:ETO12246.1 hypothetical protein RFI_25131 [Reticulomyxa filosa]
MDNENTTQEFPERQAEEKQNLAVSTSNQVLKDSPSAIVDLEKKVEQSQDVVTSTLFQSLKNLPVPLEGCQCVQHKHEILICGGQLKRDCYSYHTLKDEYKFICEYPETVLLNGYCVVKLVNNDNNKDSSEITLLSFGGKKGVKKHTLIMKYVSVWSNDKSNDKDNEINKSNNYNKWVPLTDEHNNPVIIGRKEDNYFGARAVLGGSNNNLLFITYFEHHISVFDVNTLRFINHAILPISFLVSIFYIALYQSQHIKDKDKK